MKKGFLLAYMVLSLVACQESGKKQTDWEKLNLKGKVKSVKEWKHKAEIKFGKLEEMEEKGIFLQELVFSKKGYIEYAYFPKEEKQYKYQEGNKLEEIRVYDTDEVLQERTIYKYDAQGNRVDEIDYTPKGEVNKRVTYLYDEQGKEIEKAFYNQDNELTGKQIYLYDKNDNLTETELYNAKGTSVERKTIYQDGNPIKEIYYLNLFVSQALRTTYYKYNDRGDLIKKSVELTNNDPVAPQSSYEYKYDKHGNWINKIEHTKIFMSGYDLGGYEIIKREITYYE